jgi:hypothetical protein
LLEKIRSLPDSQFDELGHLYFEPAIACPFLEDESCSIHPDRPLACREYLVSSPASACAHPSPESIERVDLPLLVHHSGFGFGHSFGFRVSEFGFI